MPADKHLRESTPARFHEAVLRLREAYAYAKEFRLSVWEYAIGLGTLRHLGLRDDDLRRLLRDGALEHGIETIPSGRKYIQPASSRLLTRKSRLVLTEKGMILANECARAERLMAMDVKKPRATRPNWQREMREFRYLSLLVKHFQQDALSQEPLLDEFQIRGWCGASRIHFRPARRWIEWTD